MAIIINDITYYQLWEVDWEWFNEVHHSTLVGGRCTECSAKVLLTSKLVKDPLSGGYHTHFDHHIIHDEDCYYIMQLDNATYFNNFEIWKNKEKQNTNTKQ